MSTPIAMVVPLLLASLAAQHPIPQAPSFRMPMPAELPLATESRDGEVLARGDDYKARFRADGVTVTARTGRDGAPASLHLRTAGATIDGNSLELPRGEFALAEARCERGGPAFAERYDLTDHDLEQSFVFTTLATRGELAIDVAVDTTLAVRPDRDGRSFQLGDDRAGFRFDRAVAIDARGARCELDLGWHGSGYRLVVPAAFVTAATLPLVVDPVLTPNVTVSTLPIENSDLVWNPTAQRFLAVFDWVFSANDRDIQAVAFDAVGTVLSTCVIDDTVINARNPSIAYDAGQDRLLVVYEFGSPATVFGQLLVGNGTATIGPRFEIAGPATGAIEASDPDVGGNDVPGGNVQHFMVAWTHRFPSGSGVVGRAVGGNGTLGPMQTLSVGGEYAPSISQSRRGSDHWLVVVADQFSPSDTDVRVFVVNAATLLSTLDAWLDASSANVRHPEVSPPIFDASGGTSYAVAGHIVAASADVWVRMVTVGIGGLSLASQQNLTQLETSIPALLAAQQLWPRVATDGRVFAIAYQEVLAGASTLDTYAALMQPLGGSLRLVEGRIPLRTTAVDERGGGVACDPMRSLFAAGSIVRSATANGLDVTTFVPTRPTLRATGCGGLTATASGQSLPGSTMTFALDGNTFGGFLGGSPSLPIPLSGCTCTLGAGPQLLATSPFTLVVPASASVVGAVVSVQGFDFGIGSCLQSFRLTDTFDVQVR
ncbi:MAG: hypothetical protein MUC36_04140 [Planctomycetes bacterium]|jgi:hypothetical protein|nr:hypothetical protein [Planctomycetota bacterium]